MTTRGQGNLLSNTKTNPMDVKAITLQSGKELKSQNEGENKATSRKAVVERDSNEKKEEETMGKSVETNEDKVPSSSPPLAPKIPFPHRLRKQKDGEQFSKFLEIFKKLHINIPLAEALVQMPKYASS